MINIFCWEKEKITRLRSLFELQLIFQRFQPSETDETETAAAAEKPLK